jgi:hypothetical protein
MENFMHSVIFSNRLAPVVLIAAAATVSQARAAAIPVPTSLQTAPTQTLALEAHAVGVQIYTCSAPKTAGAKPEWILKAPDAVLYDAAGAKVAKHYAGPTWEAADGSKVVGKARVSTLPTPSAIPWLLLDVTSTEGSGMFSRVTAVQRLATEAGKAPAAGCDDGSLGKEVRVPYKAVYRFYTAK